MFRNPGERCFSSFLHPFTGKIIPPPSHKMLSISSFSLKMQYQRKMGVDAEKLPSNHAQNFMCFTNEHIKTVQSSHKIPCSLNRHKHKQHLGLECFLTELLQSLTALRKCILNTSKPVAFLLEDKFSVSFGYT